MKQVTLSYSADAVQYHGSTTQARAIEMWIAGAHYDEPQVRTRDVRPFTFLTWNGEVTVQPSDWVICLGDREFIAMHPASYKRVFEEVNDE